MNMKNVLIGVFATTTVISAGIAIYFGITLSNEVEKNAQLEALTAQEEVEVKEETESQNINEEEYSRIFKFSDEINVVNVQDRNYTTITRSSSAPLGVGATIENDSIVCLSLEKIENDMSFDVEKYDYYPRIDFGDRKVQNVYNTGPGGTGYGFFILFLMEDGTVEYMPLAYAIANNDFRSYGKIEGAENIVDILDASAPLYGTTTLLVQKDGTAYDIGDQLMRIIEQYPDK